MSSDQFQPNFNVSSIEQVKVMRSFYENAIKSLKMDIAVLEGQIKKVFKDFSFEESQVFMVKMQLTQEMVMLQKEKRFLELCLELLQQKGTELTEEEIEAIQAQVLDEQNEEHRNEIFNLQGVEQNQSVEEMRRELKPVWKYVASLIHPDLHTEDTEIFKNAFTTLENFYNSYQISGVSALKTKIIPNIITTIEGKLSKKSEDGEINPFTTLSDLDKNSSDYYSSLVSKLRDISQESELVKQTIVTSILTVLQPHSVPDNLKTNEDLYLETLRLDAKKKELERVIDLIKQDKTQKEVMEELGLDRDDIGLEVMKMDVKNLHGEVEVLRERIVKQKETNSKQTVNKLNGLLKVDIYEETTIVQPANESELSLENQIEKDKQIYEKAKVVIKRFIEDIKAGRWETRKKKGIYYFIQEMKTDLGWMSYIHYKGAAELTFWNRENNDLSLSLRMGNDFKKAFVQSFEDKKYNNTGYYATLNTDYEESWEYYHTGTFEEVYSQCKAELKEYAGIDLDELYGVDGTKNLDSAESAKFDNQQKSNEKPGLVTAKHENQIEKRDKWNPKNLEETLQAIKELKKVIEKMDGVVKGAYYSNTGYFLQKIQGNQLEVLQVMFMKDMIPNLGTDGITSSHRIFLDTQKFTDFQNPAYYKKSIYNKGLMMNVNTDKKQFTLSDGFENSCEFFVEDFETAKPDKNGPLVFQSLKNKLKEFGVDLDFM
jgi:hypothetical protein